MYFKFIFCYLLLVNVCSSIEKNFIIEYFNTKKTPTVVGISCYNIKEKLLLIKEFNKVGVSVALNKVNIQTNIRLFAKANYWKLGVFIDFRCFELTNKALILHDASEYRMFGELHYWLFLVSNLTDILNIIDDRGFGLSTDVVIAVFKNNRKNCDLYDIYNISKERGGVLNITLLGQCTENYGLSGISRSKLNRRSNLHGFNLKAIFYRPWYKPDNVPLEVYYEDFSRNTLDGQSKFGFHLLKHLSEMYNFTLEAFASPKWVPGDKRGPIERGLANNTVDFTGTPISMNIPRTFALKYVHQDWPFRTCFIFRNPQPKNIKIGEILRPFANNIWYYMVLFVVLVTTTLFVVLNNEKFNDDITKFSNSFLITIGSLCQQGTEVEMKRMSTRIAFFSTLVFSFLMYNFYSASIVSARLDEPIFKINDSLNELGKINFNMASEPMVYFEFFLKQANWDSETFYKNYWSKLPLSNWFMPPEMGMSLVRKGGFAYHTHPDVGYRIIDKTYDNREICELMEVHLGRPIRTAFGVTTNSSIVEMSRIGLAKLAEVGIRQRHLLRWTFRQPRCRKDILSASSINIYEFAPHLICLIIGMFMSISVLAVEVMVNYFDFSRNLKSITVLHTKIFSSNIL